MENACVALLCVIGWMPFCSDAHSRHGLPFVVLLATSFDFEAQSSKLSALVGETVAHVKVLSVG